MDRKVDMEARHGWHNSTGGTMSSLDLDALLGAIRAAPALPGALCRNRSKVFDEHPANDPDRERDQHQAIRLCRQCESLTDCARWLAELPSAQRPLGVVAGQLVVAPPKRQSVEHKPSIPNALGMSPMRQRALAAIADHEAAVMARAGAQKAR